MPVVAPPVLVGDLLDPLAPASRRRVRWVPRRPGRASGRSARTCPGRTCTGTSSRRSSCSATLRIESVPRPVGVGNVHRRLNDLVEVEPLLRPAGRRLARAPQQLEAALRVAASAVLRHALLRIMYAIPYGVRSRGGRCVEAVRRRGRAGRAVRWRCRRERCAGCSGPTARARRPRCGCSRRCCGWTPGARSSPGATWRATLAACGGGSGSSASTPRSTRCLSGRQNLVLFGRLFHLGVRARASAGGRAAGAVRVDGRGRAAGGVVLRRDAAAAGPRGGPDPLASGAVPGRADDGARPARSQRGVGGGARARRRRDDRAADDADARGGRPARRPDRGHRPRARDRR